jgi:hypothetical protein
MKEYVITVTETCVYESTYSVLADSEEEARELYYDGESDFIDSEWVETLDDTIDEIKCVKDEVPD